MQAATAEAYRTLDLQPGADLGSVRQAYLVLVKVWHPDRFGNDPKLQAISDEKLKDINASYETIVAYLEGQQGQQTQTGSSWPEPKFNKSLSAVEIYKSGLERYHAGDRTSAEQLFLEAAECGNAMAQYAYGYLIHDEGYFPLEAGKHFSKVLRWWTRAAEQGHREAQFMVGTFHRLGLGTPFNEPEALKWLKLAASQGHQGAHRWLTNIILRKLHIVPLAKLVLEPPQEPQWPG
jgi:TPR repeat protein